jgi:hypothetical protein
MIISNNIDAFTILGAGPREMRRDPLGQECTAPVLDVDQDRFDRQALEAFEEDD